MPFETFFMSGKRGHTEFISIRSIKRLCSSSDCNACLSFQFWAAYVPCESQYKDAVQLTLEQIDVIRRLTEQYHPRLTLCTSSEGNVTSWCMFTRTYRWGNTRWLLRLKLRCWQREVACPDLVLTSMYWQYLSEKYERSSMPLRSQLRKPIEWSSLKKKWECLSIVEWRKHFIIFIKYNTKLHHVFKNRCEKWKHFVKVLFQSYEGLKLVLKYNF